MFQIDNRLSLKEGEKHLQQSTFVLSGVENKVSVQDVAKVKERTNQLDKEGIGFPNVHCSFPKGTLQWQRYSIKTWHKFKAKAAKNRHSDRVQGEKDSKFPLIVDQGRNKMFSTKLDCCSANSEILQHDSVKDNNRWSS